MLQQTANVLFLLSFFLALGVSIAESTESSKIPLICTIQKSFGGHNMFKNCEVRFSNMCSFDVTDSMKLSVSQNDPKRFECKEINEEVRNFSGNNRNTDICLEKNNCVTVVLSGTKPSYLSFTNNFYTVTLGGNTVNCSDDEKLPQLKCESFVRKNVLRDDLCAWGVTKRKNCFENVLTQVEITHPDRLSQRYAQNIEIPVQSPMRLQGNFMLIPLTANESLLLQKESCKAFKVYGRKNNFQVIPVVAQESVHYFYRLSTGPGSFGLYYGVNHHGEAPFLSCSSSVIYGYQRKCSLTDLAHTVQGHTGYNTIGAALLKGNVTIDNTNAVLTRENSNLFFEWSSDGVISSSHEGLENESPKKNGNLQFISTKIKSSFNPFNASALDLSSASSMFKYTLYEKKLPVEVLNTSTVDVGENKFVEITYNSLQYNGTAKFEKSSFLVDLFLCAVEPINKENLNVKLTLRPKDANDSDKLNDETTDYVLRDMNSMEELYELAKNAQVCTLSALSLPQEVPEDYEVAVRSPADIGREFYGPHNVYALESKETSTVVGFLIYDGCAVFSYPKMAKYKFPSHIQNIWTHLSNDIYWMIRKSVLFLAYKDIDFDHKYSLIASCSLTQNAGHAVAKSEESKKQNLLNSYMEISAGHCAFIECESLQSNEIHFVQPKTGLAESRKLLVLALQDTLGLLTSNITGITTWDDCVDQSCGPFAVSAQNSVSVDGKKVIGWLNSSLAYLPFTAEKHTNVHTGTLERLEAPTPIKVVGYGTLVIDFQTCAVSGNSACKSNAPLSKRSSSNYILTCDTWPVGLCIPNVHVYVVTTIESYDMAVTGSEYRVPSQPCSVNGTMLFF